MDATEATGDKDETMKGRSGDDGSSVGRARTVIGVDGCPGGWLAVAYDAAAGTLRPRVHPSFRELLAAYPDAPSIAVDIPIGLAREERRSCDVEAKLVLGRRRSSVFHAPDPRLIDAPTWEEGNRRSRELLGSGISRQVFGIFPKIWEVNELMTPDRQRRVIEVHPEVCFWALNGGRSMEHGKKRPEGYDERRALLVHTLGVAIPTRKEAQGLAKPAAADDVLDAIVAAWTARRVAEGRAGRLPADPATDARGLRMEMWY